ncbi:hypothetical protein SAMN02745751_03309 [Dethiosulfatibacter aminovorans DSM 17477]|uniref:Phosphate transport regulator (Distant homolog of PhoU) n=1 Tax=Dethiosulfatibacter aminovorans DSM 17477 TaxID=1121476 RepID=A0A1M6LY87_9FIRM|nr:DUF47 family protein [Dethiosulfatibacter aminovorans]SHJ76198.1 hypothetical protein SAMN02745751_03309 [Dethiosulfatibacter aminovorans DSM 17477]
MKDSSFLDRMFPKKYDFYSLLIQQSKTTYDGISNLESWIKNKNDSDYNDVFANKAKADKIRFQLEKDLIEAFITPFDRQDLYTISIEINKIMSCTISILKTIKTLNIHIDSVILSMSNLLSLGALELSDAISILEKNPSEAQSKIERIRKSENSMEDIYILGLFELYSKNDTIMILKYREIYNYFKDAAMYLDSAVDIYHRIIVRLS